MSRMGAKRARISASQACVGACEASLLGENWLFCGSDRGGRRTAAMYSLIVTAKMNGVDPEKEVIGLFGRQRARRGPVVCQVGVHIVIEVGEYISIICG